MGIETIPTIVARARGRLPEEMIMICTFRKRFPRRRLPKAPTAAATMTAATTMMMVTTATTTAETLAIMTLLGCI
jgi:hypothetical protein